MSKLISDDLITTIPNLYSTEDENDPICHIKLFTPDANWTWYITEFSIDKFHCILELPVSHTLHFYFRMILKLVLKVM